MHTSGQCIILLWPLTLCLFDITMRVGSLCRILNAQSMLRIHLPSNALQCFVLFTAINAFTKDLRFMIGLAIRALDLVKERSELQ